ncbi:DUF885 domain-containing protein [Lysobacter silvisoli]|nr:DUF885 family protein [Lysobacter silvisoli]
MIDRRRFLVSTLAAATAASLPACSRALAAGAEGDDAALARVLERMFQAYARDFPEQLSSQGLDRGAQASARRRLGDRSLAARERFVREQRRFLRELDAIDARALPAPAAVSLRAARWLSASYVQGAAYGYGAPQVSRPYALSHLDGAHMDVPALLEEASHWIADGDGAQAYLERLAALPLAMAQDGERAREDAGRGVVPPLAVIESALAALAAQRDLPVGQQPLLSALRRATASLPGAAAWQAQAERIVQGPLRTALQRQVALLESWRPQAGAMPGVGRLPEGEAYYRWALQHNATQAVDATELHRQGLAQLAELDARMDALLRAQGLTEGSVGQRYLALSQQVQHRYAGNEAGAAQLRRDLQSRVDSLWPLLPRYLAISPASPPDVRRLPPLASSLRSPDVPRWEVVSHGYHETLGHYVQVERAAQARTPRLFDAINLPAFHEGWGLYCERLAEEMGVYADQPLMALGYLRSFRYRAMNLIADTGLHALGWSGERTAAFIADTGGLAPAAAMARVNRHSVTPGQGVAFKCGHNAWTQARRRAQQALGERFDPRRFHDAGLRHGAVPLAVLDAVVDDWIAAGG